MKFTEVALPIALVTIVLLFILPIPPFLLDILLAINISMSIVILLNAVYAKEALDVSIFPTVLLAMTIYRLSLNIIAVKLILGVGHAGDVISGFGEFVAGGNLIVGFIIFLIIMVVNFLVITKGTERVSEVSARFTLDAMPGKQMAIDADLNSGLIDEGEAKSRRKKVQREADFFGAMDGAAKYVKNDAIAGIIITILNIVGGLILGMVMRGEDLDTALQKYTIMTIGDGLVSQIPALLISFATGIIVTRAASEGDLGKEIFEQMFKNQKALYIVSGLCLVLATVLPPLPFVGLAMFFIIYSYINRKNKSKEQNIIDEQLQDEEVEEVRKPENVVSLLQVDPIELEFGYGIIPMADVQQGGDLLDRVVMIRRQLAIELGMIVPVIRLRDNIQLSPNQYVIKIKGVEVSGGNLLIDHLLAMNSGDAEELIEGIETVEPAFNLPAVWITEGQREKAEMLGYTVVDTPSIIATHLTEIVKKFAHELLGRKEVQTILDNVKESNPTVLEELVPKLMTVGEIQKVLANLLRESVSIRDMTTVLECLADNASLTKDTDVLSEYVRQALGRAISKKFLQDGNSNVLTLDPNLEKVIMESIQKSEHGSVISLDPQHINNITNNTLVQVEKILKTGQQPIIISSPMVRLYFKRIVEQAVPGVVVLSYNELDPSLELQSIGMVSI